MLPINRRFAALTLIIAIMTGCSTIDRLARASPDPYPSVVNSPIPGLRGNPGPAEHRAHLIRGEGR